MLIGVLSCPAPHGLLYRSALLGFVLAAHGALLAAAMTFKGSAPALLERPMSVHFIGLGDSGAAPAQPLPMAAPIVKPRPSIRPTPRAPQALETTTSEASHEAAPAASTPTPDPEPTGDDASTTDEEMATGGGSGSGSGGKGSGARFDADYLKNPAPPYPPQSRRLGEEGKVTLRVLVSEEGSARQVELHASSGSARLDESALKTVRYWKFVPAQRGGRTIESWVLVPILFKLER